MTLDKHKTKEDNLMDLLDIILLMLMLVERLEGFQIKNHYNTTQIKYQVKSYYLLLLHLQNVIMQLFLITEKKKRKK